MAEYITKEQVIEWLRPYGHIEEGIPYDVLVDDTLEMKAADVAPVVRCKDCQHLMFSDCYGECGAARMGIVGPDYFCSHGERRTDE